MLFGRIKRKLQRVAATRLARRPFRLQTSRPIISFTFDDFPRSAVHVGSPILEKHSIRATYYASFGLIGQTTPTGEIFEVEDIPALLKAGHEIGCHTYDHCPAHETRTEDFECSVQQNAKALAAACPGQKFKTLSYPIGVPRPATKRRCARYFAGCRAGGQVPNLGWMDLNSLKAFFLEQCNEDLSVVKQVIDQNNRDGGWLVFATHDLADSPTRYGCRPGFFAEVVHYAVESGALLLPMSEALERLGARMPVAE